jgi:TolB-like protein
MTEPSEAPGERLESWKKIAAYLRRDVRTVQRWEQTNGLPVHRHQRAQRAIPYAYAKELDAWWTRQSDIAPSEAPPARKGRFIVAAAALLLILIAGAFAVAPFLNRGAPAPPNSIAVLPFVDLSEGMANEEFADGITAELIERLNKIPGLQIRTVPVTDGRRALGVAFVLEGSARKAGNRVRVSAQLIRVEDGTVVWSESYDRSWSDILTVQDDIASQVTNALQEVTRRPN